MTTTSPTLAQLTHAVKIAESIAALEAELAAIFGTSPAVKASAPSPVKGKRKISASHRAKLAAAAKARWAKMKAPAMAKAESSVKKRTMSPAVRKKLALAMKKRWADAKTGNRGSIHSANIVYNDNRNVALQSPSDRAAPKS